LNRQNHTTKLKYITHVPPENVTAQSLGQEVHSLVLRGHIDELMNKPRGDHVPDPVVLDINIMIGPLVVNGVLGKLMG
jgi:hypothetical protein